MVLIVMHSLTMRSCGGYACEANNRGTGTVKSMAQTRNQDDVPDLLFFTESALSHSNAL